MRGPYIEYDEEVDILFIDLNASAEIVRTLDLDGDPGVGVVIQLGESDTPLSLEIFDGSTRYSKSVLNRVKSKSKSKRP